MIVSQADMILSYLREGNAITPLEALSKFRCLRLGARIYDLKKRGHKIETSLVKDNDKVFAQYKLGRQQ